MIKQVAETRQTQNEKSVGFIACVHLGSSQTKGWEKRRRSLQKNKNKFKTQQQTELVVSNIHEGTNQNGSILPRVFAGP